MRVSRIAIRSPLFAGDQHLGLGAITALWGPNDAGKSTTLATVADGLGDGRSRHLSALEVTLTADVADEVASRSLEHLFDEGHFAVRVGTNTSAVREVGVRPALWLEARDALDDRTGFESWARLCLEACGIPEPESSLAVAQMVSHPLLVLTPTGTAISGAFGWEGWWTVAAEWLAHQRAFCETLTSLGLLAGHRSISAVSLAPATVEPVDSGILPITARVPLDWSDLETRLGAAAPPDRWPRPWSTSTPPAPSCAVAAAQRCSWCAG
jgi:hypothetical protein